MNTLERRHTVIGEFRRDFTGNKGDGEEKERPNPFTLFLILILLILSDIGAMSLAIDAIRRRYFGE